MVTFGQRIRFQAKCWRQMNFHTNWKLWGRVGAVRSSHIFHEVKYLPYNLGRNLQQSCSPIPIIFLMNGSSEMYRVYFFWDLADLSPPRVCSHPIPPLRGGVGGWLSNDRKMTAVLHSPSPPYWQSSAVRDFAPARPDLTLPSVSPSSLLCFVWRTHSSPPNQRHNEFSF